MKILITGSSGMIGSALYQSLKGKGHDVYGLDWKAPKYTEQKQFYPHNLLLEFKCDIKFDLIIHLAANARVWELVENPNLALENVLTTHRIFEFARKNNIPKVITVSSREVYGNGNELPVAENIGSQRSCESPYTASKIFGESYAWSYSRCYGIDTKIIRFSNVYGRFDFSDRFIPKVIRQLKSNEKIEVWGKDKFLDFTYLDDAVSGTVFLIENWDKMKDKEYNIAFGKGHTLISVVDKLKKLLKSKSRIKIQETHKGEVMKYEADISKMKSMGWTPQIDIDKGLKKSIEYYIK
jgi:nucleoside-diphosphate-sugar epimerase